MDRSVQKIEAKKPLVPKRKRVCAYARVSSGKDAMLHSISAQVSYYMELIQSRRDWIYAGVYADSAVTGTKDTRDDFQRMLTDCRAGKIDMIITKSISRFARNTVTMLETVRELKSIGIDVYFEKENIHSTSGDGELMLTILASFAQEESRSVSENCKWRIRHNYEEGIPNNFRVYGYRMKNRELEINETEAAVVRLIFEMYDSGKGSMVIADTLNQHSVPAPLGDVWHQKTIMELLKNEKYAGDMLLQKYYSQDHISKRSCLNKGNYKQFLITDDHEAVVDRELFNRVQKRIADKNQKSPHIGAQDYLLKGKVFCSECGARYYRKKMHTGTNSEHYVWRCQTYLRKGRAGCSNKQIPDDVLLNMADEFDMEIESVLILPECKVRFFFEDGSETIREWEINRKWSDEMKARNYENLRRRYM